MTWRSTGDRVCVRHALNLTSDLAPTNVGKLLRKKELFRFQNGERARERVVWRVNDVLPGRAWVRENRPRYNRLHETLS